MAVFLFVWACFFSQKRTDGGGLFAFRAADGGKRLIWRAFFRF